MTDCLGPGNAPNSTTVEPTDTVIFGSSDTWFQDCPPGTTAGGTFFSALWCNRMLAQIRAAIRGMGVTINNASNNMLLAAIQLAGMSPPYGVDSSSTASSIVVTLSPSPSAFAAGSVIEVKPANPCTGASTITPNGLGPYNITHTDGTALAVNDYVVGQILELRFDGTEFQIGRPLTPAAGTVLATSLAQGAAPLPFVGIQPSDNLHLSNDATNATRDIDVSVGRVRDDSDATNLQLVGAMAKRLDQAWAAGGTVGGTSGGACDTGTKGVDQTWHVYVIGKLGMTVSNYSRASNVASLTVTGHGLGVGSTVRVIGIGGGFDGVAAVSAVTTNTISYNNGGANVSTTSSGATADGFDVLCSQSYPSPAMPSGWTVKQALGSLLTDSGSNIVPFTQSGDYFRLKTAYAIAGVPSTTQSNLSISTPSGLSMEARFMASANTTSTADLRMSFGAPADTLAATTTGTSQLLTLAVSSESTGGILTAWTNTSGQIAFIGSQNGAAFTVGIMGWRDPRRRLF